MVLRDISSSGQANVPPRLFAWCSDPDWEDNFEVRLKSVLSEDETLIDLVLGEAGLSALFCRVRRRSCVQYKRGLSGEPAIGRVMVNLNDIVLSVPLHSCLDGLYSVIVTPSIDLALLAIARSSAEL